MAGNAEVSDEDVLGEHKPTVVWEKCIQQSIFVDLSEDESLHFSDLENSLALHFSQAESAASDASIHLNGSAELSDLHETSSESSIVSSQSESVEKNKKKNSILYVSAQRPNTMLDEDPENTSDEDQEDLPYDGDLGSPYFNQTGSSESIMSPDGRETTHASPDLPGLLELTTTDRDDTFECLVSVEHNSKNKASLWKKAPASTKHCNSCDASTPGKIAPSCPGPVDINQLLLLHFSQEELLQSGRLIEAETLPEVSLLESVDDTVFSLAPTQNSTAIDNNHSESPACPSEIIQSFCSGMTDGKSDSASKKSTSEVEEQRKNNNVTSSNTDSISSRSTTTDSNRSNGNNRPVDVVKQEKAEEDSRDSEVPFVRTRSFSEMKYGQGQVHYPRPDFSKVAPKVKIPKAPSGPARPIPQSPSTIHRAQSSAVLLEVISRVLEDSVLPLQNPCAFKDEDKPAPPALVHHLQAEYDKLLTKYAEAENLIDQMRLGTNTQFTSELMVYSDGEYNQHQLTDDDNQRNLLERSHLGSLASHLHLSETFVEKGTASPQSNTKEVDTASPSQPEENPSDGERMTAELRDIISQFMQNVKEFKLSVSNMLVSTTEQQMMFRSMVEAQDQLERKYISKKEEHRALEMQNYMGLSRNTGTFDPHRLVEGDIFRIGMFLEDIRETIDKNVCDQISPPHSSSTPTPLNKLLHVKPHPLCMPTPSPPQSLHEGPSAVYSALNYKVETQKEEDKKEEVEKASEVYGDSGLAQSSRVITADSFLKNPGSNSCPSRSLQRSQESQKIWTTEDEEGNEEERSSVFSDRIDHFNIVAHLSGFTSTRQKCTPESTLHSVSNPEGKCDMSDCVSLAVEVSCSYDTPGDSDIHSPLEPPLTTSSRIVSPETDSGFGSSYLNQSAAGLNLLSESVHSHNDVVSSSDSEGSYSNLQTAILSASLSSQRLASPHTSVQTQSSGAAAAVECWVESTTKETSVRLQGSDSNLPPQIQHNISAPILSTTMDTKERGSQSYSCSCNSEAILALQSEVSMLKKELEEGLVQLPHLAQKMDYLTSKYKQDRQERRSKIRTRTHHRPACNSVQPSSSRQNVRNLISSPAKIDDWISSDMDPSKSKGTDSGDTTGSKIMLQFHGSPVGDMRGSGEHSGPEFPYKAQKTLQSLKDSEGSVKTYALTSSTLKGERQRASDNNTKQRPGAALMESFYYKERWSLLSSPSLQKPLLQINYGSSSSLPASYKVRELPLQSVLHHRKRSTQSDTALLPSNMYFQRTLSPVSVSSKTGSRTGRRRVSKEEDMNKTLDQAIEVAYSMKRTTDQMAKKLSADLAKAQLYGKLHNIQPLGDRKHHDF